VIILSGISWRDKGRRYLLSLASLELYSSHPQEGFPFSLLYTKEH